MDNAKQKSILQLWRDVEAFHMPDLLTIKNIMDLSRLSTIASSDEQLPWQYLTGSNEKQWWHFVYLGLAAKRDIVNALHLFVGQDGSLPEYILDEVTGNTFAGCLMLDEKGFPVEGGYFQSTFVAGMECLANGLSLAMVADDIRMLMHYLAEDAISEPKYCHKEIILPVIECFQSIMADFFNTPLFTSSPLAGFSSSR